MINFFGRGQKETVLVCCCPLSQPLAHTSFDVCTVFVLILFLIFVCLFVCNYQPQVDEREAQSIDARVSLNARWFPSGRRAKRATWPRRRGVKQGRYCIILSTCFGNYVVTWSTRFLGRFFPFWETYNWGKRHCRAVVLGLVYSLERARRG